MRSQESHILNTLDASRIHISGKLSVSKNCKALFEAQLKPVSAGNTITRVVVEILVRNNALNALVTQISRNVRVSQHTGGIEDIQTLIFHRPHIEVINSDNIKQVEVVLETIALFIPAHRRFERRHCMIAVACVFGLNPDPQIHRLTRLRYEAVGN